MSYDITLIPGDGVGPEVVEAARICVAATGIDIHWEEVAAGEKAVKKYDTPLPKSALDSIRKNRIALKGPITTPIGTGFRSVNVALRKELDLFACIRPCKIYPGVKTNYKNVDIVVIRENTEDLYAGIEFKKGNSETKQIIKQIEELSEKKIRPDSGISIKPISESGSERIVRFAFDYALKNKRKKVSAAHKANIMKFTDGIFFEVSQKIAKEYESKVDFESIIVDNMAMQLVQKPENFDVCVLPNLYGDIISDLCAGLVGGLGVTPGASIGDGLALFEPVHGSAPKYKGQNKVNPTATILSAVLMLRYLGETKAADRLEKAVAKILAEGKSVTYDLKLSRNDPSAVSTLQMAEAIAKVIK